MKTVTHDLFVGSKRESRVIIIVEGCEDCVDEVSAAVAKVLVEEKKRLSAKPCNGCGDKEE